MIVGASSQSIDKEPGSGCVPIQNPSLFVSRKYQNKGQSAGRFMVPLLVQPWQYTEPKSSLELPDPSRYKLVLQFGQFERLRPQSFPPAVFVER